MALEDQAALRIQVPQANENLRTVMELARTASDLRLKDLEFKRGSLDLGNQQRYQQSGDINDLQGSPELHRTAASGQTIQSDTARKTMAADAYSIQQEKDPAKRHKLWQSAMDKYHHAGVVSTDFYNQNRGQVNDLVLDRAVRMGLDVPQYRGTSGETAGAASEAEAPTRPMAVRPDETVMYPGVRPGSPIQSRANLFQPPASGITPQAGTPAPMYPQANASGTPVTPGVQPKPTKTVGNQADPYYEQVPVAPIAPSGPSGAGVVQSGIHPMAKATSELGLKNLTEISESAENAAKTKASLGTMKSILEKGNVPTDRAAEWKMAVGGLLNTIMPVEEASKLVGMTLPSAEVLRKEMTRSGLLFARQTEGAREAVMAIQIALGANPQMITSREGNQQIVKIMQAAADYDIEKSKAAHAYFNKQKNEAGNPHLVGFENWFTTTHPPAQFISKAVPYQIPPDPRELKPGVTYEWKDGKNTKTGVFDPDKGGMVSK